MAEALKAGPRPVIEELHFRRESVYVSLVVNRRHRTARVVDFLAGNFPQKQAAIEAIAAKEGLERVYTLVEKEESSGWQRVGYAREGSIPGYYKRSDAYVMGHLFGGTPLDEEGRGVSAADLAAAERLMAAARKLSPTMEVNPRTFKVQVSSDEEVGATRTGTRSKKAGAWFEERFGRSGQRIHAFVRPVRANSRAGEQWVSAELQEPFGNAFVQLGTLPARVEDSVLLVGALNALAEQLRPREVSCSFAVVPVGDAHVAAAMLLAGFRKTGLLARHVLLGDRRTDGILWTRKATATEGPEAA
ncbi:MAG: hypothetical protein HY909_10770 [Deltaproteobacteria bacterium]|nr:hypothetical protein [Deltaproteobacteria bacterium]